MVVPISLALSAISGGALAAALPGGLARYGSAPLGLIALVPLYMVILKARSARTAAWSGAVFGAVSTLTANFWLANFGEFSVWTLGGPTVAYTVYNVVLAGALWSLLRLPIAIRPLAFAAAWTGYEFLKSVGYLAYPWGLAAYTFGGVVGLQQTADLVGVYGLSFLVVYANAVSAEFLLVGLERRKSRFTPPGEIVPAIRRRDGRALWHFVALAALFTVAAGYGFFRLAVVPEQTDTVRAILVQPNIDPWETGTSSATLESLQRLSGDALDTGDHDVLVWSETSLARPYREYRRSYYDRIPVGQPFGEFLEALGVPLLTGSPYIPEGLNGGAWNGVLLIEGGTGDISERYGKRRLVPFAEHVPLWDVTAVRTFFRDVVGLSAIWSPADEPVVFTIPTRAGTTQAGVLISFEGAFAPLARDLVRNGAELLINMTNNSWSQSESAQLQQFAVTRFRAIEARRPLLISTVSGLTGAVDRTGRIIASLPMFEEGALMVEVPVSGETSLTVYHRTGDVFAWAMLSFALALVVWSVVRTACLGLHRSI